MGNPMTFEDWKKDTYQVGDNPSEEVAKKGYSDYLAASQGGEEDLKSWADSMNMHPEDRAYFDALSDGERAYLRTLENTPGGQERMQFIRMTPEDRAKVMKSFNEAYAEAHKTKGQGVKLSDEEKNNIKPPLNEEVVNDTQTSEEEAAKIAEADANANAKVESNGGGNGGYRPAPPSENQKYKLKSIFQAYADGDIDKDTRDYMVINTLGTFAKNLGGSLNEVMTAARGGSPKLAEQESSLWDKRNEQMAQSAAESEMAGVEGSRENREALQAFANLDATKVNTNSVKENQKLASIAERALYDENGRLRFPVESKAFQDVTRLVTALRSGGGVNQSMLSQAWHWLSSLTGY